MEVSVPWWDAENASSVEAFTAIYSCFITLSWSLRTSMWSHHGVGAFIIFCQFLRWSNEVSVFCMLCVFVCTYTDRTFIESSGLQSGWWRKRLSGSYGWFQRIYIFDSDPMLMVVVFLRLWYALDFIIFWALWWRSIRASSASLYIYKYIANLNSNFTRLYQVIIIRFSE